MRRVAAPVLVTVTFLFTLALFIADHPAPSGDFIPDQPTTKYSGARSALDLWSRSRAYPANDIPGERYYEAFNTTSGLLKNAEASLHSSSSWKSLGPLNVWGRMLSVALNPRNPNTVYAGSASGGLWRSYTGGFGGDWHRVPLGFPALGISSIAIDSVDTNRIYIGTGEVYNNGNTHHGVAIRTTRGSYGIGILKTTDGGASWSKCLDWSMNQERGIQRLRINPLNPNTILAATTDGIYRTVDGGIAWTKALDVPMAEDIVFNPADTMFVLASCGNFSSTGNGIYLSVDGGESWYPVQNLPSYSGKIRLEGVPLLPDVVYASAADDETGEGALWRSDNFGSTWDSVQVYRCPPFFPNCGNTMYGVQGWYSHFVAVHPGDPTVIIHAGVGLTKSTNGGSTFFPGSGTHPDHHDYAHHPTNPEILYVATDGGIYVTDSYGNLFQNASNGLQTAQFYNGFGTSASDPNFARGHVQDNAAFRYNGTTNWPSSGPDEVGWTVIDPTNDNIIYATLRYGSNVIKSTNRGNSFSGFSTFSGFGAWNSPLVLSPSNPGVLYFGLDRIYKSVDAASSWNLSSNTLDGNPAISMAISSTSPDTLFVGTAPVNVRAHIFRTTNGGGAWQDVTGMLPDRYPLDLATDPNNSRNVYAAFGGFDGGHLFKSTDAGGSWSDISGTLPNVPTTAVVVDPLNSNYVYAGNDISVYVSTNGGTSWAAFSNGLPEAIIVADLVISPSNRSLRVATHGSGAYERPLLSPVPVNAAVVIRNGWNLISLPVDAADNSVASNYPDAISGTTYGYSNQYIRKESLVPGSGYWTKFPSAGTASISGPSLDSIDVNVNQGWNLIGSISVPLDVNFIGTINPGMIVSEFYRYGNGYTIADTIDPGKAYWVKTSQSGTLTLSSSEQTPSANRIRIVPTSELPPAAPDEVSNTDLTSHIPDRFALTQNYPNPFNPVTVIRYSLPVESRVSLNVYDVLGQEVAVLVDEVQEAGYKSVEWDASHTTSGIYYYKLVTEGFTETRKMLLLK